MDGHLPRRPRTGGAEHGSAQVMLLRRRAGALPGASAGDPLSFAGAGADAGITAGTHRDRRQRRVSHRHRPARRSRLARSIRRLLRDGRQPDRRGASGRAGISAARGTRRPAPSQGLTSGRRSISNRESSARSRSRSEEVHRQHDTLSHHRSARTGRTLCQHAALPGRGRRAEGQVRAPRSASGFGGHGLRTLGSLAQVQPA